MSGFDYSKWDRLEISDDETTFHPNLDTGLNIRVNRITRDRKEEEIESEKQKLIEKGEKDKAEKLESKRPLHINNVCHVAEERTIIQSSDGSRKDKLKKGEESFSVDDYSLFKTDNKAILDKFANADWETSEGLCKEYGHILMDDYANSYFMLAALDAEMKGDRKEMEKLARQGQIISQIHQLAEPMRRPARDLVPRFFEKFRNDASRAAFQEGVDHFKKHLIQRAIVKKQEEAEEAKKAPPQPEVAEEDMEPVSLVEAMYSMSKEERMGPEGLDPVEVFESLPSELQECFKTGDVEMLKQVAQSMEPKDFEHHFQRCIGAGLWSRG
ncbi:cdc37 [Symbiodinium natans]|uniref:Hsp90 chaperone protein kinase-targeting subunit n=1 Tax=Symbiodinium natans TaxID=878477 RepID=A0A812KQ18_9DINO|nr:cdc37 [Symbiodinium natans]